MLKKLTIITISAMLLGGCTFSNIFNQGNAAKDDKSQAVSNSTPSPAVKDQELEIIPSVSVDTDNSSLETDINNTKVLEEDFSDIN